MEKTNKHKIGQIERRTFTYEVRAQGENEESRTIAGTAAVFNQESTPIFDFVEEIAPGAFDKVLDNDVRALFNHDPNYILARTASGTLKLTTDQTGLHYEFEAPETTTGNDLLISVRRGDISQSSFGFVVTRDRWEDLEDGRVKRTILEVGELFDVSPVTYPAYTTTEVSLRNFEQFKEERAKEDQPEKEPEQATEEESKPEELTTELLNQARTRLAKTKLLITES